MSQVEIPQMSLQRYLDLVKRRRWQLLPVSLLGLMIGGLVAFFIPRFFVADTLLVHQQLPTGPEDREHPFRAIIDTAKNTIPLAVGETIDRLKWPEVLSLDDFARSQFEREVEGRVRVIDRNAGDRKRVYAQISVQYRDQDGDRAAEFLNTLVGVWAEKRIEEVRRPALEQSRLAQEKAARAGRTLEDYSRQLQNLERQYRIEPQTEISVQRAGHSEKVKAQLAEKKQLQQLQSKHAGLAATIDKRRDQLAEMPARMQPDMSKLMEQAKATKAGQLLAARALAATIAIMVVLEPNTKRWHQKKRELDLIQQQMRALVPQAGVDADGLVPNPDYVALRELIEKDVVELDRLAGEVAAREQAVADEDRRLEGLIEGFSQVERVRRLKREAEDERKAALADQKAAIATLTQLTRDRPVEVARPAQVPPAPTDPNILVVAMIGCVLGLGAAIGLILALDFLQGTYKTIDDVERGLSVPVLGGVSHLETDEERRRLSKSRKRVSIVAAAALFLITVLVTVFYLDPTRLPATVREILSMLLGT